MTDWTVELRSAISELRDAITNGEAAAAHETIGIICEQHQEELLALLGGDGHASSGEVEAFIARIVAPPVVQAYRDVAARDQTSVKELVKDALYRDTARLIVEHAKQTGELR